MKNFIQLGDKQIPISDETAENMRKQFTSKKVLWKPEEEEEYYYISSCSAVSRCEWDDDADDNGSYKAGNCFKTEEEAEKEIEKRKAIQRVKEYIAENCEEVSDEYVLSDDNQVGMITFDKRDKKLITSEYSSIIEPSPYGYLKTREDAQKVIDNCKEDLKLIFNI